MLDTDILSLYQHGHAVVTQRMNEHPPEALAITVITVEEQLSGWYKKVRQAKRPPDIAAAYDRLANSIESLARLRVLRYSEPALARYEELKSQKLGVRKNDLSIAAIVLERNDTLVTRNLGDFRRVPGLDCEDWSV